MKNKKNVNMVKKNVFVKIAEELLYVIMVVRNLGVKTVVDLLSVNITE